MRGLGGALVTLALVGAVAGCAAPSALSPSVVPPSGGPSSSPTPTPTPEYQNQADLVPGDCFDPVADHDDDALLAGIMRRCDEPHLMEVIGLANLDYPLDAPLPPQADIDAESEELCRSEFRGYIGIDFDDSSLSAGYYNPGEQTWGSGDREVLCIVETTPVSPFTKSVRGSRL